MYSATDYQTRRYYLFTGARTNNISVNTTLYDLQTIKASEFLFTVRSGQYIAQKGVFVTLLRWYPELNSYNIVEMSKTDDAGQTVASVESNNADYRIGVYTYNGILINMFTPIRFVCASNPCTYNIFLPTTSSTIFNIDNLQQSLKFNESSKVFTYIWNDPTQLVQSMNLTAYRDAYNQSYILCSQTSSGYSGVLTCNIGSTTGTIRAVVIRTASQPVTVSSLFVVLGKFSELTGAKTVGLFMSVILFTFAFLSGIFNPLIAIVLGMSALIPMVFLGIINPVVYLGLMVIGFIIIHFIRRS